MLKIINYCHVLTFDNLSKRGEKVVLLALKCIKDKNSSFNSVKKGLYVTNNIKHPQAFISHYLCPSLKHGMYFDTQNGKRYGRAKLV